MITPKIRRCPASPHCEPVQGWQELCVHVHERHTFGTPEERLKQANDLMQGVTGATLSVLAEVYSERLDQLRRWGSQIIPDIAPCDDGRALLNGMTYAEGAALARELNDLSAPPDRFMLPVLLEEVFEACEARAAGDVAAYRAELVQVAALAVKAIEQVDLRIEQSGEPG